MKYRVIPMQCGNDESYALVFYEQDEVVKVDVYDATTKEQVASLDTPFPVGGIPDIRYVQSYDVLFFAQPDTYPCKFKRENDEENGGYKFSFEDSEFLPEPVMEWDENSEHSIRLFARSGAESAAMNNGTIKSGTVFMYSDRSLTLSLATCVSTASPAPLPDGVSAGACIAFSNYAYFKKPNYTFDYPAGRTVLLPNNEFAAGFYAGSETIVSKSTDCFGKDILDSTTFANPDVRIPYSVGKIVSVEDVSGLGTVIKVFLGRVVFYNERADFGTSEFSRTELTNSYAAVDFAFTNTANDFRGLSFSKTSSAVDNKKNVSIAVKSRTDKTEDEYTGLRRTTTPIEMSFTVVVGASEISPSDISFVGVKDAFGGSAKDGFSFEEIDSGKENESVWKVSGVVTSSIIDSFTNDAVIYTLCVVEVCVPNNASVQVSGGSIVGIPSVVYTGASNGFFAVARADINNGFNYIAMRADLSEEGRYSVNVDGAGLVSELSSGRFFYHSGVGGRALMTIDGGAKNASIVNGQILALRKKRSFYKSVLWEYGSDKGLNPRPQVEKQAVLPSKKDHDNIELRPSKGGGYGAATFAYPYRGKLTFKTEGVWSGIVELQEIDDKDEVCVLATVSSENGLSNTELERDITDFGRRIRVACTRREYAYTVEKYSDGSTKTFKDDTGCQCTMTGQGAVECCYVRVIGKTKASGVLDCYDVELVGGCGEAFTSRSYALGAWSTKNGYPRHITIFQERLVYAGNKEKPMTVWMSKTNKWKDFELGTDDTSAITATLATEKYDSIEWLTLNKNSILLGSKYNEFSIGANDGTVTTADNILASTMSSIGGAAIPAAKVGTSTLMVKVGREELHKVEFNALSEQSTGTQVSMLARHLFEGDRIKDVFSIQSPRNMLFCVHESGKLSSLTYEQEFDVLGFARHDVLDGVESGCVIRRGGRDVLCMVVREGNSYVLGEIDFDSDVWTDDGKNYESEVLTMPLKPQSKYATSGYGRQANLAGADVYVSSDSRQFRARLVGADAVDVDWVRVDNGFNTDGELRGWDRQKVELPTTGSWLEEPMVEIKCDTAHPLTVYGIGAAIAQGN